MTTPDAIPMIDVGALFRADAVARAATDRAIMAAAVDNGFMLIHAVPDVVPSGAGVRAELLRLFTLPAETLRPLWRQIAGSLLAKQVLRDHQRFGKRQ